MKEGADNEKWCRYFKRINGVLQINPKPWFFWRYGGIKKKNSELRNEIINKYPNEPIFNKPMYIEDYKEPSLLDMQKGCKELIDLMFSKLSSPLTMK